MPCMYVLGITGENTWPPFLSLTISSRLLTIANVMQFKATSTRFILDEAKRKDSSHYINMSAIKQTVYFVCYE